MMKSFLLLALFLSIVSTAVQAQEAKLYPLKWKRTDYDIRVSSLADEVGVVWHVSDNGKWDYTPASSVDAVDHFLKQPVKTLKLGLRLVSFTYLVPLNNDEKKHLTPYLIKKHQDPVWRRSESDLIAELIAECDKRGVPLFVNTSADIKKPWALLTGESTLALLKTGKPPAGQETLTGRTTDSGKK